MRALVTGATGFLGRAIVARLRADGHRVRALVRDPAAACAAEERCIGDLRDREALRRAIEGVDAVVHAAARVSTIGTWEEFEAVNVRATEQVIACAVAAGVRRIVHVSSLSVYGVPYDGATITEESPYEAGGDERGLYARSKLAADRVAQTAAAAGAPVTIVRPGILYGPGRHPSLARRAVAVGPVRLILASPQYRLPLAYVDNIADAIALALATERAAGRTYTLVDVHAPQAEYARLYREASGATWRAVYVPLGIVRLAAMAAERGARLFGRTPPLTRHQVERTIRSAVFTTDRAREELGWQPRVELREALRRSFASASDASTPETGAPAHSPA
jgi:nucleoside-diphosphate-sugar epimerase